MELIVKMSNIITKLVKPGGVFYQSKSKIIEIFTDFNELDTANLFFIAKACSNSFTHKKDQKRKKILEFL